MIPYTIESGEAQVVASGSVFPFGDVPVVVKFFYDDPKKVTTVIFNFEDNDTDKVEVRQDVVAKRELKLTLVNFKGPIGAGTAKPTPLGENDETVLYTMFWASKSPKGVRHLEFTFYAVSRKKDGGKEK